MKIGCEKSTLRRSRSLRREHVACETLEDRIVPASLGLPQDLVGFNQGVWTVGVSNGTTAFTTSNWATWSNINWNFLGQGDFNGDTLTDVIGLNGGNWWVGLSTGAGFSTALWSFGAASWSNVNWTEIRVADLNGDGRSDVMARFGNQYWAALANPTGTAFLTPTVWGNAGGLTWDAMFLADVGGGIGGAADGRADFVSLLDGTWRVAFSQGNQFGLATNWAQWLDVAYTGLTTADMDFDGRQDLVGFINGAWYVSYSNGVNSFGNQILFASWNTVAWSDVRVGDFNGDNRGDIAGRNGGNWWVGTMNANFISTTTTLWASWANINWLDVRVGDFNGDGRDDIAGRDAGNWWVARANLTGNGFITSLWSQQWRNVVYLAVATVQVNNIDPGDRRNAPTADEEPFALFWSRAEEDDEDFSGRLLAASA